MNVSVLAWESAGWGAKRLVMGGGGVGELFIRARGHGAYPRNRATLVHNSDKSLAVL